MKKNPHAVAMGKKGGKAKTDAKKEAARKNGAKGGRPFKVHLAMVELGGKTRRENWCGSVAKRKTEDHDMVSCDRCLEVQEKHDW